MKEVIEGKMEGKRGPGRKTIGITDDLLYEELKKRAENRLV